MTHHTSNNTTDRSDRISDGSEAGHSSSESDEDRAWSQVAASHRLVLRVEDTLEVAHECMHQVQTGFFTGTYTAHDVLTLGPVLLAWADQLHSELATLRHQHQAFVDAWLILSTGTAGATAGGDIPAA